MTRFQKYLEYEQKDFYAILGLPGIACAAEVKKKYRQLALQWHPDKHPDEDRQRAAENFRQIAEAYQVLSNDNSKAEYDEIWQQFHACNSCNMGGYYWEADYQARQAVEREGKLWQEELLRKASEEADRKHYFAKTCNENGVDQVAAQQFFENMCQKLGAPLHTSDGICNRLPRSRRFHRSRF
jgi:curved DNA-binding protein CbpA